MNVKWEPATRSEQGQLRSGFSRLMRHSGREPDMVYVTRTESGIVTRVAMNYLGMGETYSRWGIQNRPLRDLCETWSEIRDWLGQLEGSHRAFIEVYPSDSEVVDTIPTRWFWLLPTNHVPSAFNLKLLLS